MNALNEHIQAAIKHYGAIELADNLRMNRPDFNATNVKQYLADMKEWKTIVAGEAARMEEMSGGTIPASWFAGFVMA